MARFIKLTSGINDGLWIDVDSITRISEKTGVLVIGDDAIQTEEEDKRRIINMLPKAPNPFRD